MTTPIRILFLADSHLGLDLPLRPRTRRRRRGHDFLANYQRALVPAVAGEVDVVVHGGDVFDRSRVPASLAWQAFEPLVGIARNGIPVLIVPGNHERSRLPHIRFGQHAGVHVFDRARTFHVDVRGVRIAFLGFPYERRNVRERFPHIVDMAGAAGPRADMTFLCMHHCVEGATVGPGNFTFRDAPDVVRGRDLPGDCVAVLSGHIHRHQVLTHDLAGRPLPAPVFYPGSIERTATAEIGERKGFLMLEVDAATSRPALAWRFVELPARPMLVREIALRAEHRIRADLAAIFREAPEDAVVILRVTGPLSDEALRCLSSRALRSIAPPSMNVQVRIPGPPVRPRPRHHHPRPAPTLDDLPLFRSAAT